MSRVLSIAVRRLGLGASDAAHGQFSPEPLPDGSPLAEEFRVEAASRQQ
jgi:hypothetical protein